MVWTCNFTGEILEKEYEILASNKEINKDKILELSPKSKKITKDEIKSNEKIIFSKVS